MTKEIYQDLESLEIWDADDEMNIEYIKSSPLYQFLDKIHSADKEVIQYMLYNICQRVIPSWEYNCNDHQLRPALFALNKYLRNISNKDTLDAYNIEIKTPLIDCRYSDTSGASGTIFNTIISILNDSTLFATYAVSSAETAKTNNFEKWLKEIALPVSFDKTFCTYEQTKTYAYEGYELYYKDLFKQLALQND